MDTGSPSLDTLRRLAEASLWRARHKDSTGVASNEFEEWLTADERNLAAWCRVNSAWTKFDEFSELPEMINARQNALARAKASHWFARQLRESMRALVAVAATILFVIAIGISVWIWGPTTYATAAGEHRTISLTDGSVLTLDAASSVRIWYGRRSRDLSLLRGQAIFVVARDVTKPFVVAVGDHKVIATGTSFNIDATNAQLLVTMISGKALVLNTNIAVAEREPKSPELRAGQQFAAVGAQVPIIREVNPDAVTAWQAGQLIFENEELEAVAARVSRYTPVPIMINDNITARRRISGVFKVGDLEGFVDAVTHYFPIRAVSTGDGKIQLEESP